MTHRSSPESAEPLADMVQCPKCQWWTNSPKFHAAAHAQQPASPDSAEAILDREEKYLLEHFSADCGIMPGDVEGSFHRIREALSAPAQCAPTDPLTDLVERFSKALLAKLRLAEANGRSGWDRDDWEKQCQEGLLRHVDKGDPRDVAAYCAFMWHHGWITALTSTDGGDA